MCPLLPPAKGWCTDVTVSLVHGASGAKQKALWGQERCWLCLPPSPGPNYVAKSQDACAREAEHQDQLISGQLGRGQRRGDVLSGPGLDGQARRASWATPTAPCTQGLSAMEVVKGSRTRGDFSQAQAPAAGGVALS